MRDFLTAYGVFQLVCRSPNGDLLWEQQTDNVVTVVGKNLAFNTFLNGNNYTVTGPYIGLISGHSFVAVSTNDTMSVHPGWLEAGNANPPTYSGNRITCPWTAAVGGQIGFAAAVTFTFTGSGTVQGAFIVYGPGALATIDTTVGTLWSATAFLNGPQVVNAPGSTVQVNYTVSM